MEFSALIWQTCSHTKHFLGWSQSVSSAGNWIELFIRLSSLRWFKIRSRGRWDLKQNIGVFEVAQASTINTPADFSSSLLSVDGICICRPCFLFFVTVTSLACFVLFSFPLTLLCSLRFNGAAQPCRALENAFLHFLCFLRTFLLF